MFRTENGIRLSEIKHVTDESNNTFAIEASISIPATACLLKKHQGPFYYKMLHRNFPTFYLRSFLKCVQLNGFRYSPCKCPQLMSLAHKRAPVNVRILYARIPNTCSTQTLLQYKENFFFFLNVAPGFYETNLTCCLLRKIKLE